MKNKVEAILFTVGRFISIEELAQLCESDVESVKRALEQLEEDYKNKNCALELAKLDDKYKLNIKKEYGYLTNKLVSNTEFDSPTTKTLAIIAYKHPILQSEVVKIRGNKAYEHVKSLIEASLISSEKAGRTRSLNLTQHFYDYFDTPKEELKKKIEEQNI